MHILGRLILNRYYYLHNEKIASIDLWSRQVCIIICVTLGKSFFLSMSPALAGGFFTTT